MRVAVKDHYGQSLLFQDALISGGHEVVSDGPLDAFLVDLDPDQIYGYRQLIDWAADMGAVVLMYPHGAPASSLCYDSLYQPYERVTGQLTFGVGEAGLLQRLGVRRRVRVIGWTLCQQLPFRPCDYPRKVLFGPTHPNVNGNMQRCRKEQNREVFHTLTSGDWELTVRYCGELGDNGLEEVPGVRYVQGLLDNSTAEIDAADLVVAGEGTFPTLAVARGIPTIFYGQFQGAEYGLPDEIATPLQHRYLYEDWVRYPISFEDRPLDALVTRAIADDPAVASWRTRWIGEPFHKEAFPQVVEDLVNEIRGGKGADVQSQGRVSSTVP